MFLKILCLASLGLPVALGQCSSTIGTNDETAYTEATDMMVYLNLDNPAQCNGTISSYRYCQYQPTDALTGDRHNAVFAVYRFVGDQYAPVSGTEKTIELDLRRYRDPPNPVPTESFTCFSITLNDPIQIQIGDVFGACVGEPDGGDRDSLNIVSKHAVGSTLYGVRRYHECRRNRRPPIVPMNRDQLMSSPLTSRILHLSAELTSIDPGGFNNAGNNDGVAAGVIIVLIVLIALAVAGFVGFVFYVNKRQVNLKTLFSNSIARSRCSTTINADTTQVGFDNRAYGTGLRMPNSLVENRDNLSHSYQTLEENTSKQTVCNDPHLISSNTTAGVHSSQNVDINDYPPFPVPYEGVFFEGEDYSSPYSDTSSSINYYSELIEMNKTEDIYSRVDPFQKPASKEDQIYSQLRVWGILNISNKDIEVVGHLGSGQFGSVEQGLWKKQGTKSVDVALKSLNKESSEEDRVKFLQEAAIMAQFRHPNVISLHGVMIKGEPMMLVAELAKKGDLKQYLLSMRPDPGELISSESPQALLKFSQQVALGMQYLSGKGFVHRDLAARNILVSINNVCKVADFGMSRDLEDEDYYVSHGGKIPVKWTAPEAIHYKKYSTASDVWAYGCLLYEIWSVGFKPFEERTNLSVISFIDSGRRLPPPPGCPKMIYQLMMLCWHPETSLRPGFRDIVLTLVGNKQMVLNIPEEDSSTNPLAGVLGAPLEAGENMYTDLQKRHIVANEVAI